MLLSLFFLVLTFTILFYLQEILKSNKKTNPKKDLTKTNKDKGKMQQLSELIVFFTNFFGHRKSSVKNSLEQNVTQYTGFRDWSI